MYNPYPYSSKISKCHNVEDLYYIYYDWCVANNVKIRAGYTSLYHEFMHITHDLGVTPMEETKILMVQRYYLDNTTNHSLLSLMGSWQYSKYNPFIWPSVRELQECLDWYNMYTFNRFNRRNSKATKNLFKKISFLNEYIVENKLDLYYTQYK